MKKIFTWALLAFIPGALFALDYAPENFNQEKFQTNDDLTQVADMDMATADITNDYDELDLDEGATDEWRGRRWGRRGGHRWGGHRWGGHRWGRWGGWGSWGYPYWGYNSWYPYYNNWWW
jgi:hypothetical protein